MTPRQEQILSSIVEAHTQSANPVGSLNLADKFDVSPATIRAEMGILEKLGYIIQPHTSAGRVPTDKGYRLYVNKLLKDISSKQSKLERVQHAIDSRLAVAGEPNQTVKSAVESLVESTHNLGVGLIGDYLYVSGLADLLGQPEFNRLGSVHEVARLLDNLEPWLREVAPLERVNVYIGEENPIGKASGCSLIISRFASPLSNYSYIGVVGPTRQSYQKVMGLVEHVSRRLEEVLSE